ncbi:GNAT family N-acetyltransferase [Silanimonas sp.]|jgi:GNAT superfamily N-acetyltransferase|uniref:GNAT family N-acetyltransferase n=1 Tax=Silanimonas sp. TaxID=1929290 RepID=UPI0022C0BA69|nr:GNAT family N-acetyltransferase [Silanimonas sp.]MCZ8063332.1 GNAT family N-acetyltransferase [Silanimonas sp.]
MAVRIVRGAEVGPFLPDLARLRIGVFREWPYLYAGNEAYERAYLEVYVRSPDSLFVLAMDGGRIVGASSGLPLADDAEAFRAPFEAAGIDIARVFYFGESVLLPEYRGRGLGHAFFDAREAHAAALGRFDWTAFCAVDRDTSDPRRTPDYRGNEALWGKRGYVRRDDLRCTLGWPEAEGGLDVAHTLTFRLRPISRAS